MREVLGVLRPSMRGAGMTEHLIVVVLVALAVLVAVRFFGGRVGTKYNCAADAVDRMGVGPAAAGCGPSQGQNPSEPSAALPDVPASTTPAPNCWSQWEQCAMPCPRNCADYDYACLNCMVQCNRQRNTCVSDLSR